jgi:formylglycine-generating enzyme required for sulfatase activity
MLPHRARGSPQDPSGDSLSPAAMLAAMQAMQQELVILRQAIHVAPAGAAQGARGGGVPGGAVPMGAAPDSGAEVPLPVSDLSLMQWMGMKLDNFDGSGTPVEAADWLTYVEDKMDVFEIVYGNRVRFGT